MASLALLLPLSPCLAAFSCLSESFLLLYSLSHCSAALLVTVVMTPVSCSFGDMLSFTLTAFVELMDHGIVSWDTFSVAFIKKVNL